MLVALKIVVDKNNINIPSLASDCFFIVIQFSDINVVLHVSSRKQ